MDIDKNEKIFTELYTNIKQQAEKSLKSLVENAHDIENFLQTDIFSQNENTNLNLIISPVQNYLRNFIEIVEYLTVWLELEIPSYSDSHDFSTVVQNEILDEIASMKTNCIAYMGQIVDYREQRALANKELFKRPQLDDNYHLIANLDYQLRRNLKIMLIEIKSYILRICNILTKNKDLIHRRQSSHYQHYF
ncbi:unnamed protein product [Rotaria socialis]|uniref:Proteasome activator PA28 C-terminal domain-containing protein n=3 Tax=Rotaria TaxID=231623 RepID=A0A816BD06_9BILA|nr:unnamed protein product [Rotaria magnacalcarata]CAF3117769.1 unnamed protein product [Rotaria socialis]CAF1608432.1 unnamed protein product [Rotaria magnacalcarata]CAF2141942.1 unnamed protein product [Rotaria magnacalcarata]CAF3442151.1 unnamed protein product [Rotaria socialis]